MFYANYDVLFLFNDNSQDIIIKNLTYLNPTSSRDSAPWEARAHFSVFDGLAKLLIGNISMDGAIPSVMVTSRIVDTGLTSCDELYNSYFMEMNHTNWGRGFWNGPYAYGLTNNSEAIFPSQSWFCRNRTLDLAIEDLSRNITLSMFSQPQLL
jgi:hypothetical protein